MAEENHEAFAAAMRAVRGSRLRTGATRWGLFRDGGAPERFVEVYPAPTWEERLRPHDGRLTGGDEEAEERALKLARGPAEVSHPLAADSAD